MVHTNGSNRSSTSSTLFKDSISSIFWFSMELHRLNCCDIWRTLEKASAYVEYCFCLSCVLFNNLAISWSTCKIFFCCIKNEKYFKRSCLPLWLYCLLTFDLVLLSSHINYSETKRKKKDSYYIKLWFHMIGLFFKKEKSEAFITGWMVYIVDFHRGKSGNNFFNNLM